MKYGLLFATFGYMGFINIKIDKVIVTQDDEVKKLLQEISDKLDKLSDDPDGLIKKRIFDTLTSINEDIQTTV
ncbi:MAG: hypothetical protein ACRC78_20080 [Planktothrix sp.]